MADIRRMSILVLAHIFVFVRRYWTVAFPIGIVVAVLTDNIVAGFALFALHTLLLVRMLILKQEES